MSGRHLALHLSHLAARKEKTRKSESFGHEDLSRKSYLPVVDFMGTTTKLQTSLCGQNTEICDPTATTSKVLVSSGSAKMVRSHRKQGAMADAIGALNSNGISTASARADSRRLALSSLTQLQDGEGSCEPRAAMRAKSGGGGWKC